MQFCSLRTTCLEWSATVFRRFSADDLQALQSVLNAGAHCKPTRLLQQCLSADDLHALQSVVNAGARLIIRKRKYEHITATYDLHWLPIRQRITYKLCTIYKCLCGAAPSYLTEMCVPVAASTGCRCLHSAACWVLMVPRTRTIMYWSCSFAVSGPRVWNDLPPTLRSSSTTLVQFQSRLKTSLFCLTYGMWLGAFVTV